VGNKNSGLVETVNESTRNSELVVLPVSLRDYFAAQALPQAIAHELAIQGTQINPGRFRYAEVAESAYLMADAMIKARST
jgi:hypothetical protein